MDQLSTISALCGPCQLQLTTLINAIQTGILLIEKGTKRVLEVNQVACELIGRPRKEILGDTCFSALPPCPSKEDCLSYDPCLQPKAERTLLTAQGHEIPILEYLSEMTYQGRDCYVCTIVDISDQVKAQEKYIRTAQEWRSTFDSISDMISIHDRDCRIVRVNKALARAFNTSCQELIGQKCHDVFHGSPHLLPTCPAHTSFEENRDAEREIYEPRLNKHLGISTSPIINDEGEMVGAVHIAKDITAAKHARDELIRMNEKLKEADQLKSEFVSITSHELRTPLSVILGALKLLHDEIPGPIQDSQRQVVQTAMENVQRLARIVDDLLDISKIEAGKLELQVTPTSIAELVQECMDIYQQVAQERNITLTHETKDAIPDILIDADRIRQVINNLISNSLKFTPSHGCVTLLCCCCDDEVRIVVQDTGRGIEPQAIPRLFNKFTQFGKRMKGQQRGTGLGLAICKGLVEQHGGRIWAESEIDQGSCFQIALPIDASSSETAVKTIDVES